MFETAKTVATDPLIGLMELYGEDRRADKLDLSVGAYRNNSGEVFIMNAVKEAEARLVKNQTSKSYVGMAGNPQFNAAIENLVLGPLSGDGAMVVRTCQTTGGSAALRLLGEMIAKINGGAKVWVPDVTYANHVPILAASGCRIRIYPYYDPASSELLFEQLLTVLETACEGDVLLVQASCHNPTGANLTRDQWRELTEMVVRKRMLPFFDVAYLGFGEGIDEDMAGLREMAIAVDEAMIAVSCSKTFTLYRERTGAAILFGRDRGSVDRAFGNLIDSARCMYYMPPDHGAAVVAEILTDVTLRSQWERELRHMRERLKSLRTALATCLERFCGDDRFAYLDRQSGMFSLVPVAGRNSAQLREESGVYVPADGRINIAGLAESDIPMLARALCRTPALKSGRS
ncbi:MAG: aromatic amino acid aminotransferase [Rhizobiaceae bacterium]|nr:aromatic amino acid aminotransferase [Rhizobiaceae bacterium]|tara:strand:+ start:190 stop:1398 length:1209 start_codon:yes stop_codon:yes gene_type:complete